MESPQRKVLSAEELFDDVGPAYEVAFAGIPEQEASLQWLLTRLESDGLKSAKVVDIGCGTGKPICSTLAAAGHDVLGIDIAATMVRVAREGVPAATFEQSDIRDFNPPEASYDAATVYFSMIASVTQEDIRGFISKIFRFLKPGGLFVFATVPISAESTPLRWMGRPVIVSSLSPEEAVDAIKAAGFRVEHDAVTKFTPKGAEAGLCKPEDVWEEPHLFVYASKPVDDVSL